MISGNQNNPIHHLIFSKIIKTQAKTGGLVSLEMPVPS
jgi:hypothetical protein